MYVKKGGKQMQNIIFMALQGYMKLRIQWQFNTGNNKSEIYRAISFRMIWAYRAALPALALASIGVYCTQSRHSAMGFLSSRPSWLLPPPHPQASVAPPPLIPGGGHTRLREREWGGANSDEGTNTLVL